METGDQISRDELLLQKLEQIVLENMQNEQFGVEDLASSFGISRSQLHRKLRKLKQKSISQFIREIRLNEALKLLQKNTGTVSEVAYQVGFNNPTYFNTSFRNHFGYTPGEAALRSNIGYESKELENLPNSKEQISARSNKNFLYFTVFGAIILILAIAYYILPKESNPEYESSGAEFKSSIAVLPFTDMSEAKDQEYFVDGISEEIIHQLAKYRDLKVSGRTSSFYYKDRKTSLDQIGQELDVANLLDGSVRKSGDRFRITVQLINVSDGLQIWSDSFDREVEDVLYIQEEIASIIARRLNVTLLNEDVRLRKVDPVAYELYLKSKRLMTQAQEWPTEVADSLIKKSISIDSTYAPAWEQLAFITYNKTFYYENIDREEGLSLGKSAIMKALNLDSENPHPYIRLAYFEWESKDVHAVLELIERAYDIAPNDDNVLSASGTIALRTNELEKAKTFLIRAKEVNPKSIGTLYQLGILQWHLGELENAESNFRLIYELDPEDYLENYHMAAIYRDMDNYDKALEYINKERNPYIRLFLKSSYAYAIGETNEANILVDEFKHYPEDSFRMEVVSTPEQHYYELAIIYAYMRDADNAFVCLDKAYDHIRHFTDWIFCQPEFINIQSDPRWDELIDRLNDEFNYNFHSE